MQVVILCGGMGTRMGYRGEKLHKSLFKIGDKPILWHLMKIFASQGYKNFILCAGHGMEQIKKFADEIEFEDWNISVVDTGIDSSKSQRIHLIKNLIESDNFFVAYGDDLANVDLKKISEYHTKHKKLVTITSVKIQSPFGLVEFNEDGRIVKFKEKPLLDEWMNGGFMIFNKAIFEHLTDGELEDDVFPKLTEKGEIYAYKHKGEWKSMNTLKDNQELNELWMKGESFWRTW